MNESADSGSAGEARAVLDELLRASPREPRSLKLLTNFPNEFVKGWYMAVRDCFREALDIRLTQRIVEGKRTLTLTQGSRFAFKEGDNVYDTRRAYEGEWSEALKYIKIYFCVGECRKAVPATKTLPRDPGFVTFSIQKPNAEKAGLEIIGSARLTQDQFVRLLISGPFEEEFQEIRKIIESKK
jgi:hypothetical protein